MPERWLEFWDTLPERKQLGAGWEPPLPLILGAWNFSSEREKMIRVEEHIRWAEQHNALLEASSFLRGLTESDWHHLGE
jgi:hypothetical protein